MRVGSRRHAVVMVSILALAGCAGGGTGDPSKTTCNSLCRAGETCWEGQCVPTDAGNPSKDAGATGSDASRADASGVATPDAARIDDAGNPSPDDFADGGCVGASAAAERQPLDLFIMLDKSTSMGDMTTKGVTKWQAVTTALSSFLNQPGMGGTSVGLQYFPSDGLDVCSPNLYSQPAVEIAPIADSASSIIYYMNMNRPLGLTPTSAALRGAVDHARAWAADPAHSQRRVAVVFATDGEPTLCDLNLDNICKIAEDGANADPQILTFVIGVGLSKGNLDRIAQSGGTGSALIIETTADVNAQFLDALNKIRTTAMGCNYLIPAAPNGLSLDYSKVNVEYSSGPGASTVFVQVSDSAECTSRNDAWHYDDANNPKVIVLCPETCKRAGSSATSGVNVVLGCKTVGPN